jgi:hypothetical protein
VAGTNISYLFSLGLFSTLSIFALSTYIIITSWFAFTQKAKNTQEMSKTALIVVRVLFFIFALAAFTGIIAKSFYFDLDLSLGIFLTMALLFSLFFCDCGSIKEGSTKET